MFYLVYNFCKVPQGDLCPKDKAVGRPDHLIAALKHHQYFALKPGNVQTILKKFYSKSTPSFIQHISHCSQNYMFSRSTTERRLTATGRVVGSRCAALLSLLILAITQSAVC